MHRAQQKAYLQFEYQKEQVYHLARIGRALFDVVELIGSQGPIMMRPTPVMLGGQTQTPFLLAAQLALEGRLFESAAMNRLLLECAAYALHTYVDGEADQAWNKRHDDDESRARCRSKFRAALLGRSVELKAVRVKPAFDACYELAIDLGAHPNMSGVRAGARVRTFPGGLGLDTIITPGTDDSIRDALKDVAEAGSVALWILLGAVDERRNDTRSLRAFGDSLLVSMGC